MRALILFSSLALANLTGCYVKRVDDHRFRTLQPQTAFVRAVAAVEQHCRGVHRADPETGVIIGNWIDANYGMGIPPQFLWYRYRVTVVDNPADGSADVRLSLQAVYCGLLDSRHPDRRESDCNPPVHIPSEVREEFSVLQQRFQEDVFRRD